MIDAMKMTEFVLARLDEDEAAARDAISGQTGRWEVAHDPHGTYLEVLGQFSRDFRPPAPDEVEGGVTKAGGHWWQVTSWERDSRDDVLPEGIADHIARHDPARSLAHCESMRMIVDEYQAMRGVAKSLAETGADGEAATARAMYAGMLRAIQALACIWSDHADFREEWRP